MFISYEIRKIPHNDNMQYQPFSILRSSFRTCSERFASDDGSFLPTNSHTSFPDLRMAYLYCRPGDSVRCTCGISSFFVSNHSPSTSSLKIFYAVLVDRKMLANCSPVLPVYYKQNYYNCAFKKCKFLYIDVSVPWFTLHP